MNSEARGIYLRGSVYWLAFQRDKIRKFISLETSDFVEAVRRAQEIRRIPELNASGRIDGLIERFVAHKRDMNIYSRATARNQPYTLRAFFDRLAPSVTPADVTSADVQAFYRDCRARLSPSSALSYLMVVRSFFNWCVEERIVRRNPAADVKVARVDQRPRSDFCEPELRDKLINECPREDLKFVLFAGFHAGLRSLEIAESVPGWFDLSAGILHLRKTPHIQFKDREERTIPITTKFRAFLEEYGLRSPYMLRPTVGRGRNRYRYDFRRPFGIYMREQGAPWVTPHVMRHTFASLLASAGVDIYKISVWMGNDVRVVQKHYAKLLPNDREIDRAFG